MSKYSPGSRWIITDIKPHHSNQGGPGGIYANHETLLGKVVEILSGPEKQTGWVRGRIINDGAISDIGFQFNPKCLSPQRGAPNYIAYNYKNTLRKINGKI